MNTSIIIWYATPFLATHLIYLEIQRITKSPEKLAKQHQVCWWTSVDQWRTQCWQNPPKSASVLFFMSLWSFFVWSSNLWDKKKEEKIKRSLFACDTINPQTDNGNKLFHLLQWHLSKNRFKWCEITDRTQYVRRYISVSNTLAQLPDMDKEIKIQKIRTLVKHIFPKGNYTFDWFHIKYYYNSLLLINEKQEYFLLLSRHFHSKALMSSIISLHIFHWWVLQKQQLPGWKLKTHAIHYIN